MDRSGTTIVKTIPMKLKALLLGLSLCVVLSTVAVAAGGVSSRLDASYFSDSEELALPPVAGRLGQVAKHKQDFCKRSHHEVSRRVLSDPLGSTLAFYNPDGTFNTGLCWLHTRFQRAANYLGDFKPELPKPTRENALKIIETIADGDEVVEIPGFKNLHEFSAAYKKEMTSQLNQMATKELFNLNLADRFGDRSRFSSDEFSATMDDIYDRQINNPHLMFLRERAAHYPTPFHSHSLLLFKMVPLSDGKSPFGTLNASAGYRLTVLDPNSPNEIFELVYRRGATQLRYCLKGENIHPQTRKRRCRDVTLYVDYEEDMKPIERAITSYCFRAD